MKKKYVEEGQLFSDIYHFYQYFEKIILHVTKDDGKTVIL